MDRFQRVLRALEDRAAEGRPLLPDYSQIGHACNMSTAEVIDVVRALMADGLVLSTGTELDFASSRDGAS